MKIFLVVVIVLCIITLVNVLIESYRENRRISFSNYQLHDRRIRKKARIVRSPQCGIWKGQREAYKLYRKD